MIELELIDVGEHARAFFVRRAISIGPKVSAAAIDFIPVRPRFCENLITPLRLSVRLKRFNFCVRRAPNRG